MTLNQLKAFYWAAKLGTFAIAADRLHVTQSSLSKRIAELETDIGQQLFDRSGKRAVLTGVGSLLLEKARRMIELEEEVRSSLTQDIIPTGLCRFGLSEFSATTWFPSFVQRLGEEYPTLTIGPIVGLSRLLERLVERGELDLAVIAGTSANHAIASKSVAEVSFSWMSSPSRLAAGTILNAKHLQEHPVISSTSESGLSFAFESWLAAYNIKIGQTIPCNSLTAITGLTVAGIGVSFLPTHYVQPLINKDLLVALRSDPPLPVLKYSLIWRRDDNRRLIQVARDLLEQEINFSRPNTLWGA
ncbi:LysR family transcriptional regulator [Pseudomonas agarici]|uniref:LysR family transcriptional regulator n=1 Tax=Pseudomonas agarici TaxID=46677 RepID=A0A0X1T661_PSEAA|nr:LysR family transcriptional regulator [Pseudomonas agarici]AMB87581.1 LysR family transcriptional regulator [Pseudomonas agarici]